ncbi:hypothetical protein AGOR_G00172030 [Albula goreensis]|uniref:Uncharacterized protein n=1 Tax=Albula goreensis TaxID=1534307 RepID=A0A8T3CTT8_9TELE|nr:hypothetical protein AGOR_G00172030 [Albula goreensis]
MKTEPVIDSTDYAAVEFKSVLLKSEDTEESVERKNDYWLSREEKLVLSNMKNEEEEGGERQREVKGEDGVKDEEGKAFKWNQEEERDNARKGDGMENVIQSDRGLKTEGAPNCTLHHSGGLLSLVTSCSVKKPMEQEGMEERQQRNYGNGCSSEEELIPSNLKVEEAEGRESLIQEVILEDGVKDEEREEEEEYDCNLQKERDGHGKRAVMDQTTQTGRVPETSGMSHCDRHAEQGVSSLGKSGEFSCSQCPFIHTDEVKLQQHIEKLVSAAMWQVVQQQHMVHYGKLEEGHVKMSSSSGGGQGGGIERVREQGIVLVRSMVPPQIS